jgi:hypothetical protein
VTDDRQSRGLGLIGARLGAIDAEWVVLARFRGGVDLPRLSATVWTDRRTTTTDSNLKEKGGRSDPFTSRHPTEQLIK